MSAQKKPEPAPAAKFPQPVVQPSVDVTLAAFTKRELDMVRGVLRDADGEAGLRAFQAALARAGK